MRDPFDSDGNIELPEWEPEPLHLPLHLPLNEREPAGRTPTPEESGSRGSVIVIDLC